MALSLKKKSLPKAHPNRMSGNVSSTILIFVWSTNKEGVTKAEISETKTNFLDTSVSYKGARFFVDCLSAVIDVPTKFNPIEVY